MVWFEKVVLDFFDVFFIFFDMEIVNFFKLIKMEYILVFFVIVFLLNIVDKEIMINFVLD